MDYGQCFNCIRNDFPTIIGSIDSPVLDPGIDPGLQETDQVRVNETFNGHQTQRGRSSPKGFWHGGPATRRPSSAASLHSRSSSMNSSLRGSEKTVPFSLNYIFDKKNESSRGLPQAPVTLDRSQAFFDCDICGESLLINRRREWQSV